MVDTIKEESRYKVFQDMGDNFVTFIRRGIIPVHLSSWKVIYENYLSLRESCKKTEAAKSVAAKFEISTRQVFIIIKFMES